MMEISMAEESDTDMVHSSLTMVTNTRVSGKTTSEKVMARQNITRVMSTSGTGKIVKGMAMEPCISKMVTSMRVDGTMVSRTVLVLIDGGMERWISAGIALITA